MKRNYFLLLFSFVVITTNAQVGIGTLTPSANSTLEIVAPAGATKPMGVILPKVTQAQINALTPADLASGNYDGMIFYDGTNKCMRSIKNGVVVGCLEAKGDIVAEYPRSSILNGACPPLAPTYIKISGIQFNPPYDSAGITFATSNPAIMTVDPTTGGVSGSTPGNTNLTITYDGVTITKSFDVFIKSTIYTSVGVGSVVIPMNGITSFTGRVYGGGGGGKSGASGGGPFGRFGGGGGAHAAKTYTVSSPSMGQVIPYTVGAKGLGEVPGVSAATDGGTSTLTFGGNTITATGGKEGSIHLGGTNSGGSSGSVGGDGTGDVTGKGGDGGTGASGGANAVVPGDSGVFGFSPSGGGGGGSTTGLKSGDGGLGQVLINYTCP